MTTTGRPRDVYIAIMVAEAKGKGLHLTFEELQALTLDDAIATRASNALNTEDWGRMTEKGWAWVNPYADRGLAANEATRSDEDRAEATP